MNTDRSLLKKAWPLSTFLLASMLVATTAHAQETARDNCFNHEGLSTELREKSETYLLKALDTEHLFTLVSGLKPMSAGFYGRQLSTSVPAMSGQVASGIIEALESKAPLELTQDEKNRLSEATRAMEHASALQEIEDLRTIVGRWRCGGEIHAEVVHYATPYAGKRQVQGVIFALPSLKQKIEQKSRFFSRWAMTSNSNPVEVLMAVEYSRDVARFAGYGYLFGYPEEAVDFFVNASIHQDMTGEFVTRDFRAIPTFERETGQFTYAVPKGFAETPVDRELKARADAILAAYKRRRADYVGDGKPGVAAMLRDWFCPTDNDCSPANARL